MTKEFTPAEILALPMQPNDANAPTILAYLKELLRKLWQEGEGFSGKRPFGNSGWEDDLLLALLKGDAISGVHYDDYWDIDDDEERRKGVKLILDAIAAIGGVSA